MPVKSTKMFKLRLLFSNGNQDQREGQRNSGAYIPGVEQQQRLKRSISIYLHEPKKTHWAAKPLKSIEDVYFNWLQSNLILTPLSHTQADPDSNTAQTQTDPDSTPCNHTCTQRSDWLRPTQTQTPHKVRLTRTQHDATTHARRRTVLIESTRFDIYRALPPTIFND